MESNGTKFVNEDLAETLKQDIEFLKVHISASRPLVDALEKDLKYKTYCLDTLTFRELTTEEIALLASNENEVAAIISNGLRGTI